MNSKQKGNRFERKLVEILNKRFSLYLEKNGGKFIRNHTGSGAMVGKSNRDKNETLNEEVKSVLAGDIIAPKGFKFHIECKSRKNFDLENIFNEKAEIFDWIEQAKEDCNFSKLDGWIVAIFINYKKPIAIINHNIDNYFINNKSFTEKRPKILSYKNETDSLDILLLEDLLKLPEKFFFKS